MRIGRRDVDIRNRADFHAVIPDNIPGFQPDGHVQFRFIRDSFLPKAASAQENNKSQEGDG